MEMKGNKNIFKAYEGDTFIYAWWFKLKNEIEAGKGFYHIFQLKNTGANSTKPTLTFGLKLKFGLHIALYEDYEQGINFTPMLPMELCTGKWFQVDIKISTTKI